MRFSGFQAIKRNTQTRNGNLHKHNYQSHSLVRRLPRRAFAAAERKYDIPLPLGEVAVIGDRINSLRQPAVDLL